jgi:hypothetical protein
MREALAELRVARNYQGLAEVASGLTNLSQLYCGGPRRVCGDAADNCYLMVRLRQTRSVCRCNAEPRSSELWLGVLFASQATLGVAILALFVLISVLVPDRSTNKYDSALTTRIRR